MGWFLWENMHLTGWRDKKPWLTSYFCHSFIEGLQSKNVILCLECCVFFNGSICSYCVFWGIDTVILIWMSLFITLGNYLTYCRVLFAYSCFSLHFFFTCRKSNILDEVIKKFFTSIDLDFILSVCKQTLTSVSLVMRVWLYIYGNICHSRIIYIVYTWW